MRTGVNSILGEDRFDPDNLEEIEALLSSATFITQSRLSLQRLPDTMVAYGLILPVLTACMIHAGRTGVRISGS
jgi:hypothetical protein